MRPFLCTLFALGLAGGGKLSAWELQFQETRIYGYAFTGGVIGGYYLTNWVPILPNLSTNLSMQEPYARSSNTLWLRFSTNSVVITHDFDLRSGGRGSEARAGLRAAPVRFTVVGAGGEPAGTAIPFAGTVEVALSLNAPWQASYAYGAVNLREWDAGKGNSAVVFTLAATNGTGYRMPGAQGRFSLRIGSTYLLECTTAAAPGDSCCTPEWLAGTILISLTEGFFLDVARNVNGPRVTLTGQPGCTYLIERSTNFSNWQQIVTNTPSSGTFVFDDVAAPVTGAVFYRGVEKK